MCEPTMSVKRLTDAGETLFWLPAVRTDDGKIMASLVDGIEFQL